MSNEPTAVTKARGMGWDIKQGPMGWELVPSARGNPVKEAQASLEILGYRESGLLWQNKAGELASLCRDGTVIFF